ncbi:hypothetical protein OAX78_00615 [Planctomycetota bacterium]|nr:hypothetical protein [Planctomycetota bacterium]
MRIALSASLSLSASALTVALLAAVLAPTTSEAQDGNSMSWRDLVSAHGEIERMAYEVDCEGFIEGPGEPRESAGRQPGWKVVFERGRGFHAYQDGMLLVVGDAETLHVCRPLGGKSPSWYGLGERHPCLFRETIYNDVTPDPLFMEVDELLLPVLLGGRRVTGDGWGQSNWEARDGGYRSIDSMDTERWFFLNAERRIRGYRVVEDMGDGYKATREYTVRVEPNPRPFDDQLFRLSDELHALPGSR